jgi:hypothetical protein
VLFNPNLDLPAWKEQDLGLLDLIMAENANTLVEHYSHYFEKDDFKNCIKRSLLYESENQSILNKQEPFTWVLTARLSKPMESKCAPTPDSKWRESLRLDLIKPKQEPILRLAEILKVGIIVIERLPLTEETMWLKLLGEEADCKAAYEMIKNSPRSRKRSATIKACAKFNAYVRSLPQEELTEEDMVILRTTADVDRLYAKDADDFLVEGQLRMVTKLLVTKFGEKAVTEEITEKLQQMSPEQLDDFFTQAIGWSNLIQIQNYFK